MAEDIQHPKQNSFGQNVKMAMVFPAITEAGSVAFAIKRSNGVKGAIEALELEKFKKLNTALKQGPKKDVFSRGIAMSSSYENYKDVYKNAKSAQKKLAKINKRGDLSLKQKFLNLFKKDKIKFTDVKKSAQQASDLAAKNLSATKKAIDQGTEITKDFVNTLQKGANTAKTAANAAKGGFGNSVKTLFKKEMSSKFNLVLTTLTTFVPNLVENVIPAFKEKGFVGGVKELGKATFQTGADFVSYGIGGALGRTVGSGIGLSFFGPIGAFVGGLFGDALGSVLIGGKVCDTVDKKLHKDKPQETEQIEDKTTNEIAQIEDKATNEIAQYETKEPEETKQAEDPKLLLSCEEAQKKYQKISTTKDGVRTHRGYIRPQNGVYHTGWVNDIDKSQIQKFDNLA